MVDLGAQNKKAGPAGSAVPEAYRGSVEMVAGVSFFATRRYLPSMSVIVQKRPAAQAQHIDNIACRCPRLSVIIRHRNVMGLYSKPCRGSFASSSRHLALRPNGGAGGTPTAAVCISRSPATGQVLGISLQHRRAGPRHGSGLRRAGQPRRGPRPRACQSAIAARRHRSARTAPSDEGRGPPRGRQGHDLRGLRQGLCRGASAKLARRTTRRGMGSEPGKPRRDAQPPAGAGGRSPAHSEGAGADLEAKPNTAARVRARIERVLDWATVARLPQGRQSGPLDGPSRSPAAGAGRVKVRHHAALPYAEVAGFVAGLRERQETSARAFEFLILTATRTSEVLNATWDELDAASARLDDQRRSHEGGARASGAAIGSRQGDRPRDGEGPRERHPAGAFVFPAGPSGAAYSNTALLMMLRRMGRGDLTAHGFRSTFRDWAAERTNYPARGVRAGPRPYDRRQGRGRLSARRSLREAAAAHERLGEMVQQPAARRRGRHAPARQERIGAIEKGSRVGGRAMGPPDQLRLLR